MLLDGKRVVVIGGSSGIGLETARQALAEGALVTIAGRSEERLRRAAESISLGGDRLRSIVADLSDESSIRVRIKSRPEAVDRLHSQGMSLPGWPTKF